MLNVLRALKRPDHSFFLFGPRGCGKSTWLKQTLPEAFRVDLLDNSISLLLGHSPHKLASLIGEKAEGAWVIIDEIQKIPALLDEVHRLMEEKRYRFALCGSSARKLRRTGVNLLGGRALTLNMESFSAGELAERFDLDSALEWGTLPILFENLPHAPGLLSAYLQTYIKEEIREESVIRRLEPFLRFLQVAGQLNGQTVNMSNIAAECMVSRSSVQVYFSILIDTLLGHFLPAWQPRLKVREVSHPKFYWFDSGVARAAAGLLNEPIDRGFKGYSLETLIYHELRVYNESREKFRPLYYYGSPGGGEIDFIIETRKAQPGVTPHVIGIEVKGTDHWNPSAERTLRSLAADKRVIVDRMVGVYQGEHTLHERGLDIYPAAQFLKELHAGNLF